MKQIVSTRKEEQKLQDLNTNLRNLKTRIYPLNKFNCKVKGTKERISKFERTIESSQSKQQWKKNSIWGKNKHSFRKVWDLNKSSNICVIGVSGEEGEIEKNIEKMNGWNFPKFDSKKTPKKQGEHKLTD